SLKSRMRLRVQRWYVLCYICQHVRRYDTRTIAMEKIQAPPQKGSIERAPRLLPLGKLLASLLIGALFCVIATLGFVWLAVAVLASRFITVDDQIITWPHG